MGIDLAQLETFLAVAREGSFSRAAEKLFRTQPAVSQAIRRLEDEIGEALFDRSSRDGTLTDAGRLLQEYAERMLNMRAEAVTAVQELRELRHGKLTVAANEFTCLYVLPMLEEFRSLHPMVHIAVQRTLASRVAGELLNRSVELGVLTFAPEQAELRSVVVYRDELAFVVPPRHPLAGARQVSIRELGTESFVAHNVPSPYRAKVLETFGKRKVPLHMNVEMPSIDAIKRFVAAGNGVALLPLITVESELARGELVHVPVPELRLERKLRIVFRRNVVLSHAARAFLEVAKTFAQRHGGRFVYQG